jgi:iron complex outermembrane receptor protein
MNKKTILRAVSAAALLAAAGLTAQAQETANENDRTLDTVVTVGTRVANRSALDTAVAVDVVSSASLEQIGVGELNQALSTQLPSYNFPRPALNDGTDSVRPATLRGLAPDQTLVLVNGKRRHSASLVNVNGSIGRGSSAVDLNTIPTFAVSAIEVLRDGASAQYGSDAIAGVLNVKLREAAEGGAAEVSYGWRETEYSVPVGTPADGLGISVPARGEISRRDAGWLERLPAGPGWLPDRDRRVQGPAALGSFRLRRPPAVPAEPG